MTKLIMFMSGILLATSAYAETPPLTINPPDVLYKADCIVLSFGKNGANPKQLAQMPVELVASQKIEVYRDKDYIFHALASHNSYNKQPAIDVQLEIVNAKTGRRISASGSVSLTTQGTPPLLITGTQDPNSDTQYDIQCLQTVP